MNPLIRMTSLVSALLVMPVLAGEQIALQELGALELVFSRAELRDRVPGTAVWAQVSHRPGAAFRVYAPERIQQANYRVDRGQRVAAGQPIVELSGPEIHHWQLALQAVEQRYRLAEARYQRNKPLYEQGSIAESRWLEIVTQRQELELEFEHKRHFAELLAPLDEDADESFVLLAPFPGRVDYPDMQGAPVQEALIAAFLPEGGLRLRARVPLQRREALVALRTDSCTVEVSSVSARPEGFMVDAWSEALDAACGLLPGQTLEARPLYRVSDGGDAVLSVPRTSLLAWQQQTYVLQREDQQLLLRRVSPLTLEGTNYLVQGPAELAGVEVLSSSVSAIQGLLLGLGGE